MLKKITKKKYRECQNKVIDEDFFFSSFPSFIHRDGDREKKKWELSLARKTKEIVTLKWDQQQNVPRTL